MKKIHRSLPLTALALTMMPGAVFAHESTFLHSHGNEFLAAAALLVAIVIGAGIAIKKR